MTGPSRPPRLRSTIPVGISPGPDEPAAQGQTRDLSTGGLCFVTSEQLDVGRAYWLQLELPPEEGAGAPSPIRFLGRVAWTEPAVKGSLVGVEFLSISLQDQRRIYRYLDEL